MERIYNISMVLCTQFNLNLPRLRVAYSGPDIAGLPSRSEGHGMAMLQAGTATAAYPATRLIMMAIAYFQSAYD